MQKERIFETIKLPFLPVQINSDNNWLVASANVHRALLCSKTLETRRCFYTNQIDYLFMHTIIFLLWVRGSYSKGHYDYDEQTAKWYEFSRERRGTGPNLWKFSKTTLAWRWSGFLVRFCIVIHCISCVLQVIGHNRWGSRSAVSTPVGPRQRPGKCPGGRAPENSWDFAICNVLLRYDLNCKIKNYLNSSYKFTKLCQ